MKFSTEEIRDAVKKARKAIVVRDWGRDDMGDPVTDETVQAFASYVISHYGKAILETLITDKAADETRGLVIAERKVAGL